MVGDGTVSSAILPLVVTAYELLLEAELGHDSRTRDTDSRTRDTDSRTRDTDSRIRDTDSRTRDTDSRKSDTDSRITGSRERSQTIGTHEHGWRQGGGKFHQFTKYTGYGTCEI